MPTMRSTHLSQRRLDVAEHEPVPPPRDGVAQRAIRTVEGGARALAQLPRVRLGGLVTVGMQRTRHRMVAPLEVLPVDREPPRQAEDGEQVAVRKRLWRLTAGTDESRPDAGAASPALPILVLAAFHAVAPASPVQTTN